MSGSKPRRGLASFLSNELVAQREPQVPEAPAAHEAVPEPLPRPPIVEHPEAVVEAPAAAEPPPPRRARAIPEAEAQRRIKAARARTAPKKAAPKSAAPKSAPKKAAPKKAAPRATMKAAAKKAAPKKAAKRSPKAPLYLRLTRKEARLREDQIDGLAKVARRLTRAKGGSGTERLTENTLLRVAVDLLLAHADALEGVTESQLRASVLGK